MTEQLSRKLGRYELLDVIGQGGMGIVYRAIDPSMGRTVAIKMLHGAYAEDKDLLARFHSEVRFTASLQHRNIVTVFTLDDFNGFPYMVMEYLEGQSMAQIIASSQPIQLADKLRLVSQVCEGLQYAHERGVIHRDIKPANVIVLKDGVAKIVDFGIARVNNNETLTRTGQIIGSVSYMSPEQIGGVPLDARTDIYSTGVMLYQFLTAELPFVAEDPNATFFKILNQPVPSIKPHIREHADTLDGILSRAMAKRVSDRYQTAEEFGFELVGLQDTLKRGMTAQFLSQAGAAVSRKEWESARQVLQEVLRRDRSNDQANEMLSMVRREIQRQQKSVQIDQLRTRAQVARASREYAEAIDCIEQALRVDPLSREFIDLLQSLRDEADRAKQLGDALGRGQAALYAGDLNEAAVAVRRALELERSHTGARALETLIQKELAERNRRAQLQELVTEARADIANLNFPAALQSLRSAHAIDPSDSNVRELIAWAARGHEQQKTRDELQSTINEVGQLLSKESFAEAVGACEVAIQRFPQEASLSKLQELAKRRHEMQARRRTIEDLCLRVRLLADAGKSDDAIKLLRAASLSFPGELQLETLQSMIRAEQDRKLQDVAGHDRIQESADRQIASITETEPGRLHPTERSSGDQVAAQGAYAVAVPGTANESEARVGSKGIGIGTALVVVVSVGTLLMMGVLPFNVLPRSVEFAGTSGARITASDKECQAPCSLRLSRGKHVVVATLAGYQDLSENVYVAAWGRNRVVFDMKRPANREMVKAEESISAVAPRAATDQQERGQPRATEKAQAGSFIQGDWHTMPGSTPVASEQVKQPAISGPSVPTVSVNPVPAAVLPPTSEFTANELKINQGQVVTLTWQAHNATEVQLDPIGPVNSSGGSLQLEPQQSVTYNLIAKNAGGFVTKSIRVDVASPGPPPVGVSSVVAETAAVLQLYRQAYESKDLLQLRHIWPTLTDKQFKNLQGPLKDAETIHLILRETGPAQISGATAQISCSQETEIKAQGQSQVLKNTATFFLRRLPDSWVIDRIDFKPLR